MHHVGQTHTCTRTDNIFLMHNAFIREVATAASKHYHSSSISQRIHPLDPPIRASFSRLEVSEITWTSCNGHLVIMSGSREMRAHPLDDDDWTMMIIEQVFELGGRATRAGWLPICVILARAFSRVQQRLSKAKRIDGCARASMAAQWEYMEEERDSFDPRSTLKG